MKGQWFKHKLKVGEVLDLGLIAGSVDIGINGEWLGRAAGRTKTFPPTDLGMVDAKKWVEDALRTALNSAIHQLNTLQANRG